jgi:hypothetical protein
MLIVHNYDTILDMHNIVGAIHTLEMTFGEVQNVPQVQRFQLIVNVESKGSNSYSLRH